MRPSRPPRRGEVWKVDLPPNQGSELAGRHWGLVISHDLLSTLKFRLAIVLTITSDEAMNHLTNPSYIPISAAEGLDHDSWIQCDQPIRLSWPRRFRTANPSGNAFPSTMQRVEEALLVVLGIDIKKHLPNDPSVIP